jgi:hypothetical protein
MPEQYARDLVADQLFPRRPLELKLVARLHREAPAQIDELKRDLRSGGARLKGLFAGLVYRRILLRMSSASAAVKQLAFPGLVLRYLTPALIRRVLVPSLGLPEMSPEGAERALDELAAYSWFAQREPTGELRYRRDLRRATLKVARAEEAEKSKRIHVRAIEWFEGREDPQPAEALYHRLILATSSDVASIDVTHLRAHANRIRTDIDDLPPLGEAFLLFAIGEALRPEQIALLPSPQREEGYRRKGKIGADAGEYGLAWAMHDQFRRAREVPVENLEQWEVETLFATVSWERLSGPRQLWLRKASEWRSFVAHLFSGAVLESIGMAQVDGERLSRHVLDELVHSKKDVSQTDLARLAFALVLIRNRHEALTQELASWTTRMLDKEQLPHTQWAGRNAIAQMVSGEAGAWVKVALGTPISIDPAQHPDLERVLMGLVPGADAQGLNRFLESMAKVVNEGVRGRWTALSILSAINSMVGYAPTCFDALNVDQRRVLPAARISPPEALDGVAAVNPEFRDPLRFALREAFSDDFEELRQLLVAVVPFELDDLKRESFARELSSDLEHALRAHVELIDRCGKTGELLARARSLRPSSSKLELVARAHDRWRLALRRLFETTT